jgi:hypothetical protein
MRRKRLLALVWAGIVGLLLLGGGCAAPICSEAERSVLAEFPQYGGQIVPVEGNVETAACAVYYEVPDSAEQTRSYFLTQLTAHGWTVDAQPAAGTLVTAQRGPFSYVIYYETLTAYPGPNTHLAVHVSEN